jgi:RNA polymerase sigma-70 factor (ECF subfamily)
VHAPRLVNGEPGVVYDATGDPVWASALEVADGVVVAIRSVLNPESSGTLPPVSDCVPMCMNSRRTG